MSESFSQVVMVGALRHPVQVEPTPSGAAVGVFELLLRKQTATGWFTVLVPCKVWGKGIETARTLRAGQPVCFQGELARHKGAKGDTLCVSGWSLEPLTLPAPEALASASRN